MKIGKIRVGSTIKEVHLVLCHNIPIFKQKCIVAGFSLRILLLHMLFSNICTVQQRNSCPVRQTKTFKNSHPFAHCSGFDRPYGQTDWPDQKMVTKFTVEMNLG